MLIIKTREELKKWRGAQLDKSIGFVPTMGALHEGHLELVKQSKRENNITVVSIFVNPLQFGPSEDFHKYPRVLEDDCKLLAQENVDVVFNPSVENFYGENFSISVEESLFSQGLCGTFRPGHFKGVATVVLKLLNLVRPNAAYFGEKDFQQCLVIKKMVQDLDLKVLIKEVPTIREKDGLAKSSRNRYLQPEERHRAAQIYQLAKWLETEIRSKKFSTLGQAKEASQIFLEKSGFKVQYIEIVKIEPTKGIHAANLQTDLQVELVIAAYLGSTRLIDHFSLRIN